MGVAKSLRRTGAYLTSGVPCGGEIIDLSSSTYTSLTSFTMLVSSILDSYIDVYNGGVGFVASLAGDLTSFWKELFI
jgi:hypothetical protein